jgi:hypothetical protein
MSRPVLAEYTLIVRLLLVWAVAVESTVQRVQCRPAMCDSVTSAIAELIVLLM